MTPKPTNMIIRDLDNNIRISTHNMIGWHIKVKHPYIT